MYVTLPDGYVNVPLLEPEFTRDLGADLAGRIEIRRASKTLTQAEKDAVVRNELVVCAIEDSLASPNKVTTAVADTITACQKRVKATRPEPELEPVGPEPEPDPVGPESDPVEPDPLGPESDPLGPESDPLRPHIVEADEFRSIDGRTVYIPARPPRVVGPGFARVGAALGLASVATGGVLFSYDGQCEVTDCSNSYDTSETAATFTSLGILAFMSFAIALVVDEVRLANWKAEQRE